MAHLRRSLLPALLLTFCLPAPAAPPGPALDRAGLEAVEDASESLANELLALSVELRDRNLSALLPHLAPRVAGAPLPVHPGEVRPVRQWVRRHAWEAKHQEGGGRAAAQVVEEFRAVVDHFSEMEDFRLKVLHAELESGDNPAGSAHLKFFVVGRDQEGRREWMQGRLRIQVTREDEGPWVLRSLEAEYLKSMVSDVDLFSDVTRAADLEAIFPPIGVGKNEGFVSHGAAVADVNGDGLLDLAVTGVEHNRLYAYGRDGRFHDASELSLVSFVPPGTGAVFLDYDQDGDPDLFLAAVGEQVLLENRLIPDGKLEFWDVSERAGVNVLAVGFSAVAGDVNGDGLPDIYVASYNRYGHIMPNSWHDATNGTPNLLFLNQGDGTFREVARRWGVDDSRWGYAASFVDVNLDGKVDLYVANDFGVNGLYVNDGKKFRDTAAAAGLRDPGFGMGVSFGDVDNDGDLDLHITNMSSMAGARVLKRLSSGTDDDLVLLEKLAAGNSVYRNHGDGTFQEISAELGGFPGGWAFGGGWLDFDNDGWQDLHTPNGFLSGKSMKDT
jgi:hypothetical protein